MKNKPVVFKICSKLQHLPDVEEQFCSLGISKTVSQSQEVGAKEKISKVEDDDDKVLDEGDERLYKIIFQDATSNKFTTRYFDEDCFKILDMTSKKLEVKKKTKLSQPKKSSSSVASQHEQPLSGTSEAVPQVRRSQELIIPFTLDVNKPPPPPNAPINTAYDWWLQRGAQLFPNVQLGSGCRVTMVTAASASRPSVQSTPTSMSNQSSSSSAPNIVQTQPIPPKSHQFSLN